MCNFLVLLVDWYLGDERPWRSDARGNHFIDDNTTIMLAMVITGQ